MSDEKIDGTYLFWVKLPLVRPKNWLEGILFNLGLVKKRYLAEREKYLLAEYNRHTYETVIGDRKILLDKLMEDRAAVGEGLLKRIEQLREENARLQREFEEYKRRGEERDEGTT